MLFSAKTDDARYSLLADPENHELPRDGLEKPAQSAPGRNRLHLARIYRPILIPLLVFLIAVLSITGVILSSSTPQGCSHPRIRREWRTFSMTERRAYIDAAVCLTRTESPMDARVTIHDDFAYLHSRLGNYCTWVGGLLDEGERK